MKKLRDSQRQSFVQEKLFRLRSDVVGLQNANNILDELVKQLEDIHQTSHFGNRTREFQKTPIAWNNTDGIHGASDQQKQGILDSNYVPNALSPSQPMQGTQMSYLHIPNGLPLYLESVNEQNLIRLIFLCMSLNLSLNFKRQSSLCFLSELIKWIKCKRGRQLCSMRHINAGGFELISNQQIQLSDIVLTQIQRQVEIWSQDYFYSLKLLFRQEQLKLQKQQGSQSRQYATLNSYPNQNNSSHSAPNNVETNAEITSLTNKSKTISSNSLSNSLDQYNSYSMQSSSSLKACQSYKLNPIILRCNLYLIQTYLSCYRSFEVENLSLFVNYLLLHEVNPTKEWPTDHITQNYVRNSSQTTINSDLSYMDSSFRLYLSNMSRINHLVKQILTSWKLAFLSLVSKVVRHSIQTVVNRISALAMELRNSSHLFSLSNPYRLSDQQVKSLKILIHLITSIIEADSTVQDASKASKDSSMDTNDEESFYGRYINSSVTNITDTILADGNFKVFVEQLIKIGLITISPGKQTQYTHQQTQTNRNYPYYFGHPNQIRLPEVYLAHALTDPTLQLMNVLVQLQVYQQVIDNQLLCSAFNWAFVVASHPMSRAQAIGYTLLYNLVEIVDQVQLFNAVLKISHINLGSASYDRWEWALRVVGHAGQLINNVNEGLINDDTKQLYLQQDPSVSLESRETSQSATTTAICVEIVSTVFSRHIPQLAAHPSRLRLSKALLEQILNFPAAWAQIPLRQYACRAVEAVRDAQSQQATKLDQKSVSNGQGTNERTNNYLNEQLYQKVEELLNHLMEYLELE